MIEYTSLGVDDLTLIVCAGGVFEHAALGSDIALQDSDRALFRRLVHREDDLIALETVVMQITEVALEPVVLVQILEVLAQRLAGDGHDVQIEHVAQQPLYHRYAAGEPERFGQMGAGRIDVAQMRDLMVDLVEQLDRQIIAELSCDRREMDGAVGRAADGRMHDDSVFERCGGQDLGRRDLLFDQLHDLAAGIARILEQVAHGSRNERRAGERQTERLSHALHGGSRTEERARADGRTAGQLVVADLLRGDGVLALLAQGNVARDQRGRHIRTGAHGAARHEDGRNIHAGCGLEVRRDRLVAARRENHAVPRNRGGVNLYHVGDGFAGRQNDVHAVVTLRAAVADVGSVVLGRLAAALVYAVNRLLYHLVQVVAARVRIAVYALDHNLRLEDVGILPSGAHFEGVELRPEHAVVMAFLNHNLILSSGFGIK